MRIVIFIVLKIVEVTAFLLLSYGGAALGRYFFPTLRGFLPFWVILALLAYLIIYAFFMVWMNWKWAIKITWRQSDVFVLTGKRKKDVLQQLSDFIERKDVILLPPRKGNV